MAIKKWILAIKPWSFSASAIPCLLTMSYIFYIKEIENFGEINWLYGFMALIAVVIFQAVGNLFNDYFDYVKDIDKENALCSRILVDKIFTPKQIFYYGLILLLVAITIGISLCILLKSWEIFLLGVIGAMAAVFYNKAKYIALGDLCIFIAYGLLIGLGTTFVLLGFFYWKILLVNIPLALLIVAILHANNTRDMNNDKEAGIKTMAILLDLRLSKIYFTTLIVLAFILVVVYCFLGILPYYSLIVYLSLPIAIIAIVRMLKTSLDKLQSIQYLTGTVAKIVLFFGLLLSLANILAGII